MAWAQVLAKGIAAGVDYKRRINNPLLWMCPGLRSKHWCMYAPTNGMDRVHTGLSRE